MLETGTNALVLETNALKTSVQTSAKHTQLAISNFQTNLSRDDCYTHKYSPPKTGGIAMHALVLSSEYATYTSTSYTYSVAFPTGLNGLQVDLVDRQNNKRTSTYSQLVPSKRVAACNALYSLTVSAARARSESSCIALERLAPRDY